MLVELRERILTFWFGELDLTGLLSAGVAKRWFRKSEETDRTIEQQFKFDLLHEKERPHNQESYSARDRLALIILFDQFSRNIYRNTPQAFTQDKLAQEICLTGLDQGQDGTLHPIQRAFFYMPLQHAEDLALQHQSVYLFNGLVEQSTGEIRRMVSRFYDYAIKHYEVILRFGRFPHRNAIFNRVSTAEETAFLELPGSSF